MIRKSWFLVLVLIQAMGVLVAGAQQETDNAAQGPVVVTGEVSYTLGFFNEVWIDPQIILYDMAGVVDRELEFTPSFDSQVFGFPTSDTTESPFTYEITLPAVPQGEFRDVDNDDEAETGVQVFTLGIIQDLWGNGFMEERDEFLFDYTSAEFGIFADDFDDVLGGTVLVWAPDDEQSFPDSLGEDGKLFTEDDTTTSIPAGWSIARIDEDGAITFDRSAEPEVALVESEGNEQDDFSELSYTEAFNATIDKFTLEYAFTEEKGIDWEALRAEFLPLMEEAEAEESPLMFRRALLAFANSIPDGHMFGPFLAEDFQFATSGGLGFAIRDVDDGRTIVSFVTPEGPAEMAGIERGAEILALDGQTVDEAIEDTIVWSAPFSTPWVERLQALRYVVRVPLDTEVEVTFQNPDADEPETVTLTATGERESFNFSSFNQGLEPTDLPVEFEILDSGFGYIKLFSFFDNLPLTIELWERAMAVMRAQDVPGIIVDMRQNGGGFTDIGYQMISYFFDSEDIIEYSARFDEQLGEFYVYEELPARFTPPAEELRYNGELAVLIAPSCASACEYVTRALTLNDRATTVGQYPTQGIGGGWQPFFLPEDEQLPAIQSRVIDADRNLIVEGIGVAPDIEVPVTEETLFSEGDPVLETAIAHLEEATALEIVEAGEIAIGDTVEGEIDDQSRVQYTMNVTAGDFFDVFLSGNDGELNTVVRLYIQGSEDPVAENDDVEPGNVSSALEEIEIPQDFTLIVEVGTFGDALSGAYTLEIVDRNSEAEEE